MILKIVSLFLVFMVVLGMFGKLHVLKPRILQSTRCKACGRHKIGRGPCACGGGGKA